MPEDNAQLLRDKVARNGGLVMSLPDRIGLLRHHKSRFLAAGDEGIWIESVRAERELIDELIATGRATGFSFKVGHTKVVFATQVLRRDPNYAINADLSVEAVLLRQPEELRTIQRRESYRAAVTADSDVSLRLWRMNRNAFLKDRPPAAHEITARLRDISTGGIGVVVMAKDNDPPRVTPDDRLRVQLTLPGGAQLLLEGRLRYPVTFANGVTEVKAGIQFKQLNDSLEDRTTIAALSKLVGEMQRAEVRRFRLGIA